jgi:EAL domain-containing protein (putative c-di-GMP-specific phosphodiesterase class I)
VCERIDNDTAAIEIAQRLADQLSPPFLLGEAEVFTTASIGIALSGEDIPTAEDLVRNADMAMYKAKERGRDRWALFEEDLAVRALARHELEQALRGAIESDQFVLHYQPLVRLADGAVVGVEALVRWARPGRGVVEPGAFIPLAEETGLIVPIGAGVVREACKQAASWIVEEDQPELEMAVNLSARQIADADFFDMVVRALDDTGLDPARLCFEITEGVLVEDVNAAIETVEKLKSIGVQIAIDDFGTGYATLEYLRRFSMADYLKIDRSFVEGVDSGGSKETAIVAGAIALAKSLGLTVVAEGVETAGQLATLRGLECDMAQGYYFSRPLPAPAAMALLEGPPTWLLP